MDIARERLSVESRDYAFVGAESSELYRYLKHEAMLHIARNHSLGIIQSKETTNYREYADHDEVYHDGITEVIFHVEFIEREQRGAGTNKRLSITWNINPYDEEESSLVASLTLRNGNCIYFNLVDEYLWAHDQTEYRRRLLGHFIFFIENADVLIHLNATTQNRQQQQMRWDRYSNAHLAHGIQPDNMLAFASHHGLL